MIGPPQRRLPGNIHNTHTRPTFMPPAGFEPAIPVNDRPQTLALDRWAFGNGPNIIRVIKSRPMGFAVSAYIQKILWEG